MSTMPEIRPRPAAASSGAGYQSGSSRAMVGSGDDASPVARTGSDAASIAPQAIRTNGGSVAPTVAQSMDAAPELAGR